MRTVSAAGVTAAIVFPGVVVMIAVKIAPHRECTFDESLCNGSHVAGRAADNFDTRLSMCTIGMDQPVIPEVTFIR